MKLRKRVSRKSHVDVGFRGDFGKVEKARFDMEFRILTKEEAKDLLGRAADDDLNDVEIIQDYALGWTDVQDEGGNDMEFTPENVEIVMNDQDVYSAIMTAFMEDLLGKKAKVKK
jgi:hypothetical protein